MDPKPQEKKPLLSKLRNKYRLVVMHDETFEERFVMRLSRMNVLLSALGIFIGITLLVALIIIFTPVKRYIPGYSDSDTRLNAYHSATMADSLAIVVDRQSRYLANIQRVLRGDISPDSINQTPEAADLPTGDALQASPSELSLRERVEQEEALAIVDGDLPGVSSLSNSVLYTPLQGMVSSSFSISEEHYGVDIVSPKEEAVKAVLDGTVILASWTFDTGYVIQIQHQNDLVSVYKHNAVLLKSVGDHVAGGEAIAIVGESGELTDGPHLHFELWSGGKPLDPEIYLVFS
jgi:murein DD-endopeptidase MepM/ murein hydrolase activator NlpD